MITHKGKYFDAVENRGKHGVVRKEDNKQILIVQPDTGENEYDLAIKIAATLDAKKNVESASFFKRFGYALSILFRARLPG